MVTTAVNKWPAYVRLAVAGHLPTWRNRLGAAPSAARYRRALSGQGHAADAAAFGRPCPPLRAALIGKAIGTEATIGSDRTAETGRLAPLVHHDSDGPGHVRAKTVSRKGAAMRQHRRA